MEHLNYPLPPLPCMPCRPKSPFELLPPPSPSLDLASYCDVWGPLTVGEHPDLRPLMEAAHLGIMSAAEHLAEEVCAYAVNVAANACPVLKSGTEFSLTLVTCNLSVCGNDQSKAGAAATKQRDTK